MRYFKITENGYITAIGKGSCGEEINQEEHGKILAIVKAKPTAEPGYEYRLKEDLTWELVEVPVVDPTDEEISGEELLNMIEEVL